ncbi:MAG: hypothetical protein ABIQ89_02755 [Candidatus Saccharimonadales bacterium]
MPESKKPITGMTETDKKVIIILSGLAFFVFVVLPIIVLTILGIILGAVIRTNDVRFTADSNGFEVIDKNGNQLSAGNNQQLAKDFPISVPVYPDTLLSSGKLDFDNKTGWEAVVTTKDNFVEVKRSIEDDFTEAGWGQFKYTLENNSGKFSATKDNLTVNIFFQQTDNDSTIIAYTVVQSK